MEYKEVEGFATKEDLKDMIECLKKGMPAPVVVEVFEKKTPVVVVMEMGHTMNSTALCLLRQKFGEDVIILDHKQAIEQGLRPNPAFEREPIILKANPVMHQRLIATKRDDDKPWYDRFQKKRGKKR